MPILAFQSPTMVQSVFGREKFDALLSTPKNFVCFQLPDPVDAEWAAKRFASYQGFMRLDSGSSSSGSSGSSSGSGWSESFQTIENVTTGMIQAFGVPTPGRPVIEGFMATIPFKPFRFEISIPELVHSLIPKVAPAAPPGPRDPKDFLLLPWREPDLKRLRLV